MKTWIAIGTALTTAMGCGSAIPNGSTPGTGTGTLRVAADVVTENRIDNPATPNGFDTRFEVVVQRAGQTVEDASVVLISASGRHVLSLEGSKYKGGHVGYDRYYTLEVTAGADSIRDATIAGPSAHHILSPVPGTTTTAGEPLQITWSRDGEADTARVETKDFKLDSTADVGVINVPGEFLKADGDKTKEDRVTVWRTTRVGLAGGVLGSEIRAEVRNRVETFLVAPSP